MALLRFDQNAPFIVAIRSQLLSLSLERKIWETALVCWVLLGDKRIVAGHIGAAGGR
jgi:hypothetical protein